MPTMVEKVYTQLAINGLHMPDSAISIKRMDLHTYIERSQLDTACNEPKFLVQYVVCI